jgi:uncharacterized protein
MRSNRDFLVMAKPAGPRCDLRCGYCYYVGNETAAAGAAPAGGARPPGRMSEEFLELYIAQRLEAAGDAVRVAVHFEWHGGEPTLLGLDYFKRIARMERRLAPESMTVTNGIQTNGLGLDAAWADFLAAERWSVGLSLDGPADIHDAYRRTAEGRPTHARVMRSYETLARRGVLVNLLCVLTKESARKPDEVYGFFHGIGARYLQFLPLVTPAREGRPQPEAAPAESIGDFLCRAFDLWIASDLGRLVVQNFDEALRPIYGLPHALCVQRETCGEALALERDGSLYTCDHFVDPQHLLGNIRERSLASLAADPKLLAFGEAKRATLPRACRECEFLSFCNGGCPKDRIIGAPDGDGFINYLCPAYKRFFAHARPGLEGLAAHLKSGRPISEFC